MEGSFQYVGLIADSAQPSRKEDSTTLDPLNEALVSIRRILRATEIHGKALRAATNLKTSQLMVLQALDEEHELTVGQITDNVRMAQASVTAIVLRLEQMGLVERQRGTEDKRKVFVHLTKAGHEVLDQAPVALHERFADKFEPLEAWEKSMIVAALQRVAAMMNAADLEAAPLLEIDHNEHG